MPTCQGKRKDGQPCGNRVSKGKTYCQWHEPDKTEDWREVYERLEKASPEEKTEIVLRLIEEHPEGKLELPQRDGVSADLHKVDLSSETLGARVAQLQSVSPVWWDANIKKTNLMNANLEGADLSRANLEGANLEGADLSRANLQGTFLWNANLQRAKLEIANLQGAILWNANLQGAKLTGTNLQGAELWGTRLQGANLYRANLQGATLSVAKLQGADLSEAQLQHVDLFPCYIVNIFISEAWLDKTRLRWEQLGGAIGEELTGEYKDAQYGYLILKQNFDDLGDYDAASKAYCKERRMEKLTHWPPSHTIKYYENELPNPDDKSWRGKFQRLRFYLRHVALYISDWFVELLCDYGESVWRVLAWIAVVLFVIGPALVGWQGQLKWPEENYNLYFSLPTAWQQWRYAYIQNVLYMLDTFTTADFAKLEPANDTVRLTSGFLAMVGIFLVGLLGFVVGNRIRRS